MFLLGEEHLLQTSNWISPNNEPDRTCGKSEPSGKKGKSTRKRLKILGPCVGGMSLDESCMEHQTPRDSYLFPKP